MNDSKSKKKKKNVQLKASIKATSEVAGELKVKRGPESWSNFKDSFTILAVILTMFWTVVGIEISIWMNIVDFTGDYLTYLGSALLIVAPLTYFALCILCFESRGFQELVLRFWKKRYDKWL